MRCAPLLVALALALGCSTMRDQLDAKLDAAGAAGAVARYDAGVRDVGVVADVERCDAQTVGKNPGLLCRGDAATARSVGVRIDDGLCVYVSDSLNCGACGNHCTDGLRCLELTENNRAVWRCGLRQAQ